jgi:hypothetical protein
MIALVHNDMPKTAQKIYFLSCLKTATHHFNITMPLRILARTDLTNQTLLLIASAAC